MTSISFEVGAVFLLAAMLLYGSLSGFLPRALHAGKAAPIGIGCCLLAYALYRTVPELPNLWRDADSRPAPPISSPPPARNEAGRRLQQPHASSPGKRPRSAIRFRPRSRLRNPPIRPPIRPRFRRRPPPASLPRRTIPTTAA